MWNDIHTGKYEGMIAETVTIRGYNGDPVNAYYSRPLGDGNFPGLVLIPHMPGWDEYCREAARRFTQHGYAVVCPDIYCRFGQGNPAEIAAKARETGGSPDEVVMGDCQGAVDFLKVQANTNGKVGAIGMCSGGRHAFMAACRVEGLDAAVDCWGGNIFGECTDLSGKKYNAMDFAKDLKCPLLGIFGNDDKFPTPDEVNRMEAILKELGKDYEFHRYDGAGHGIWYYHTPMYRQQQAMDSQEIAYSFLEKNLR